MSETRAEYLQRINATRLPVATPARRRARRSGRALSTAADRSGGVLACPVCGGTQFKAHRSLATKVAFGFASLLGEGRHVRCVTCGTDYRRG